MEMPVSESLVNKIAGLKEAEENREKQLQSVMLFKQRQ